MKVTTIGSKPETIDKAFDRGELAGRRRAPRNSCPYTDPAWRRMWADGYYFGKWQSEKEV